MTRLNARRRLTAAIGHLEICTALLETAETELAEKEESAAWGTRTISATRSTTSSRHIGDPTGTHALSRDNQDSTRQRRNLQNAIANVERSITHLRLTLATTAGAATTDTSHEQRCPEMILLHDHQYGGDVLRACGALTASTPRPDGTGMVFRQDGRCLDHGRQADDQARQNEQHMRVELNRRQRRRA